MPAPASSGALCRCRSGSNAPRTANSDSAPNSAEKDAQGAINAFRNPAPSAVPPRQAAVYTPDEQRDLNRLIQQQNPK